ncbi:MAG: MFS transporter [Terracidiphilus sp.]|nr:MFS transporter [Terracidiphilus sp.]MDR3798311.1 MFS transporter [Terracidiphilus sp.]
MSATGSPHAITPPDSAAIRRYNAFLLLVAGLGGLLYGIDVGIIGGAYPYLAATSGLTASQLSVIVAAVLLGSVLSTLFAGLLADWMGRKPLMILSGCTFALSIPIIALSQGYAPLFFGRLLQGMSGGLIGVVVPLYLAECLSASNRGKGTAIFQWLLTLGIVAAALIGMYFSYRVAAVTKLNDATALSHFEDHAWRSIFWVSLPPGLLFVLGGFFVTESPRWLFLRNRKEHAYAALLKSRSPEQASRELEEMEATAHAAASSSGARVRDSLLRRKYLIPFLLACVILAFNQATGINSIIGYNAGILLQSGLSDLASHWGYVIFTVMNFLATTIGMVLVDRKGRKFLLVMGTCGVIVATAGVGLLFRTTEKVGVDCRNAVQAMAGPNQEMTLRFDAAAANRLIGGDDTLGITENDASLVVIYSYGDFTCATNYVRSDDAAAAPIKITRASCVPANKIVALFSNPFANLAAAQTAPLKIEKALLGGVPDARHGWLVAIGLYLFIAFYALGPGVVVWLALSELMPTRIRSNGMSVALVLNQMVSTTLAAIFLPFVSKHGYSSIFFLFAGCTVVYMSVAAFFLPETKGKTLEEIEAHFEGNAVRSS